MVKIGPPIYHNPFRLAEKRMKRVLLDRIYILTAPQLSMVWLNLNWNERENEHMLLTVSKSDK